jgi:hypothetical protein
MKLIQRLGDGSKSSILKTQAKSNTRQDDTG